MTPGVTRERRETAQLQGHREPPGRAAPVPGTCPQDITAVRGCEGTCLPIGPKGRVGFQQLKWRARGSLWAQLQARAPRWKDRCPGGQDGALGSGWGQAGFALGPRGKREACSPRAL